MKLDNRNGKARILQTGTELYKTQTAENKKAYVAARCNSRDSVSWLRSYFLDEQCHRVAGGRTAIWRLMRDALS
jgi:hypothetical protein